MSWSFRLVRIAGIDIKVHFSFLLILILGAIEWSGRGGVAGPLFGVVLMILLFVCVTLHELGHSLVANRFGSPVREIILLPLGGVSLMERNPQKPVQELLIAAAGPLVNVVIALILFAITGATGAISALNGRGGLAGLETPSLASLLLWLLAANISLVLFNLIPAFPLDGGRIFRAILAMFMSYPLATRIASIIGQLLAVVLGVIGVTTSNFILVLIAVFVFFGAGQDDSVARAKTVLATERVGDAYNKHALTLTIGDRVSKVVDYILTSYQPDFAVLQGTKLLGIVTRSDVLHALAEDSHDPYVTQIMHREVVHVEANQSLDEVRQVLTSQSARTAAVFDGQTYLGLVNLDDISEAFAVLTFVQRHEKLKQTAQPGAMA